jgi:hypothetical protein
LFATSSQCDADKHNKYAGGNEISRFHDLLSCRSDSVLSQRRLGCYGTGITICIPSSPTSISPE